MMCSGEFVMIFRGIIRLTEWIGDNRAGNSRSFFTLIHFIGELVCGYSKRKENYLLVN